MFEPWRDGTGWRRIGGFVHAHQQGDFRAKRFFVKRNRVIAAAIEKQVGFNFHRALLG
jgi:hypothetical protein